MTANHKIYDSRQYKKYEGSKNSTKPLINRSNSNQNFPVQCIMIILLCVVLYAVGLNLF